MVSLAGTAGYAWSALDFAVISGSNTNIPGNKAVVFDQFSMTNSVAINSVAAGAVTAMYEFHYTGSHSAFTRVYAWVVADDINFPYDPGNTASWPNLIDFNTGLPDAVQVTNEGVNLAPDSGSTTVLPVMGGTIVLSNSGPYTYGQVITATASADPGYFFSGWSVTGSSTLSNSAAASTSLTVYDDFTLDRHVLPLTINVATDTWSNNTYTVTVTQSGPGVVTPTQTWNAGTLVTPATTASWTVPVGGNLSGYLVGGRVNGPVNKATNLAATGSCTVTVSVVGDVSGETNAATATVTITVRPLGDINGSGHVDRNDLAVIDACLNAFNLATTECDLSGDGHITMADRVLLNLVLNGLPVP
jgi:hypothetical protein